MYHRFCMDYLHIHSQQTRNERRCNRICNDIAKKSNHVINMSHRLGKDTNRMDLLQFHNTFLDSREGIDTEIRTDSFECIDHRFCTVENHIRLFWSHILSQFYLADIDIYNRMVAVLNTVRLHKVNCCNHLSQIHIVNRYNLAGNNIHNHLLDHSMYRCYNTDNLNIH